MSSEKRDDDAVARLSKLASDLQKVYPEAGSRIAKAIAPVNEAVSKIGVAFDFSTQFYQEAEGDTVISYRLVAARKGIAVAVDTGEPRYVLDSETDERVIARDQFGELEREWSTEVKEVSQLPLPIRIRILDAESGGLADFTEEYEKHVRQDRAKLLNGSIVQKPMK